MTFNQSNFVFSPISFFVVFVRRRDYNLTNNTFEGAKINGYQRQVNKICWNLDGDRIQWGSFAGRNFLGGKFPVTIKHGNIQSRKNVHSNLDDVFLQTLNFHCFRWLKEKNST